MSTPWGHFAALALRQVAAESYLSVHGRLATGEALIEALVRGANAPGLKAGNTLRLTPTLAARLVRETEIVAQHENDASGLSATLMRDRRSGDWHLALRGTEFRAAIDGGDWERDGIDGADGQLASHGLALTQIDRMRRVFEDWSERHALEGEPITVSGYSLGGHLAAAFTELYPEAVREAVGFNSPTRGIWTESGATLRDILDFYRDQARGAQAEPFPGYADNVYRDPETGRIARLTDQTFGLRNLVTQNWVGAELPPWVQDRLRIVHGHALHGDFELIAGRGAAAPMTRVLIEGQPTFTGTGGLIGRFGGAGHTHSLTLLVDALLVHDAIARLAPGLGDEDIAYLLAAGSLRRAEGRIGFTHHLVVEGDTLERGIDAWRRLFLGDDIAPLPWNSGLTGYGDLDTREALHQALTELERLRAGAPALTVMRLDAQGPADLQAAAIHSSAHRYALWALNPFVVTGDDALFSLPGRAERLAALSPAYLQARAEFAHRFWAVAAAPDAPDLSQITRRYLDLGGGHDLHRDADAARVVFGSIRPDVIVGTAEDDRLFGDDGNDHLEGGAGDDLLEGGPGDDLLEGGKGADRLVGGAGFDFYRAGAGDVLQDADGRGRVDFAGLWLGHAFLGEEPGTWKSWDDAIEYRLSAGGLEVRGPEVFTSLLLGASRPRLFIEGWQPGELGIHLLDVPTPRHLFQDVRGHLGVRLDDDGRRVAFGPVPGDPEALLRLALERPQTVSETRFARPVDHLRFDAGNQAISLHAHPGPVLWVETGAGEDFVSWSEHRVPGPFLRADLGSGHDRYAGSPGVDQVLGGDGRDHIMGYAGDDHLSGDGDGDLIDGGVGDDRLAGGAGTDWLLGGAGRDLLMGGAGPDVLLGDTHIGLFAFVEGSFLPHSDVHFHHWDGSEPAFPDGIPFLRDVPAAEAGADWLSGGEGDDHLFGGHGDDQLEGDAGNDLQVGEGGDDRLQGGDGNDLLIGDDDPRLREWDEAPIPGISAPGLGDRRVRFYRRERGDDEPPPGNDRLEGGRGNDELRGGLGDDTYVYRFDWGEDLIDDAGGRDHLLLSGTPEDWRLWPDFIHSNREDLLVLPQSWFGSPGWDLLRVRNWFGPDLSGRIETFGFEDGSHWRAADQVAALRERSLLELGFELVFGPRGGLGHLKALNVNAHDATFRVRGSADADVIDARSVTLEDGQGQPLGTGVTSLAGLRREGMDLLLDIAVRQPPAAPPATTAVPAPLLGRFSLHLEGWFDPARRVELVALDDRLIGRPDAPPVATGGALEAYVDAGRPEWRIPEGAFQSDELDLLSLDLRLPGGAPLPSWLAFDPVGASLRATPDPAARDLYTLELVATDLGGSAATRPLLLNVGMPVAPRFTQAPEPLTVTVGATRLPLPWRSEDPNTGDTPRIELLDHRGRASAWATASELGVSLRPGLFDAGVHELRVRLVDRDGLVTEAPWQVTVLPPSADVVTAGGGVIRLGTPGDDRLIGSSGDDLFHGGPGADWLDGQGGEDLHFVGPGDGIDTLVLHPGARQRIDYAPGVRVRAAELAFTLDATGAPLLTLRITGTLGLDLPGLFAHEARWIDGEQHLLVRLVGDVLPDLTLRDAYGGLHTLSARLLGTEPAETRFQPTWFAAVGSPAAAAQAAAVRPERGGADAPGLRLAGGATAELLIGSARIDRLYGGDGADRLLGQAGDDLLYGEAGDDHLDGGPGADWLSGGAGDDRLIGGVGPDDYVRAAGGGHDVIEDREGHNRLWLVGGVGVTGFALRGQDVRLDLDDGGSVTLPGGLDGHTVQELLWATSPGSEPFATRTLHQVLHGLGWGDATPRARADDIYLRLVTGVPLAHTDLARFFDAGDVDPLRFELTLLESAGARPDWLRIDAGSGRLGGRPVDDDGGFWLWQIDARDPAGQTASARLHAFVVDELVRFGTAGNDLLHANPGRRSLLHGLAGNDTLIGGPLDDVLAGGSGRDRLHGGGGSDRLLFSADRLAGPFDRVQAPAGFHATSLALTGRWLSDDIHSGGEGTDVLEGSEGDDALLGRDGTGTLLIDGVEFFLLRGGNDLLALHGWMSDIEVWGGTGDDILLTGSGNDRLDGGAGDDWLSAGAGDDLLEADHGQDLLQGGPGNDTYSLRLEARVRIEDTGGNDTLEWLTGEPEATLTARRSGDDLHLAGAVVHAEVADWFRPGASGRIEHIVSATRRLDVAALEDWLVGADAAAAATGAGPGPIPEAFWSEHRWEDRASTASAWG